MNKLKYILGICLASFVSACTDFVEPAIPYADFETGVYLRTITVTPNVSLAALSTSQFDLEMEAVDEKNGELVQEVEIYVSRRRGAAVSTEALVTTVAKSAFVSTSASKYLRATVNIPFSTSLAAMGMTTGDIAVGDYFEFRLALLDTKGRVFTNSNRSSDVSGGAFYASPFFYRVTVVN